jgi:hypothetical protein
MSTIHDGIAEADRQIERMKVRVQQQRAHVANLEHGHFESEAQKARTLLDRMVGELALLRQHRFSLYQQAAFGDVPKKKVS